MNKKIMLSLLLSFYSSFSSTAVKPYTLMVYIAGDNDLEPFINRNLHQMSSVMCNEMCNIITMVGRREGKKRTKKVQYIEITYKHKNVLKEFTGEEEVDSASAKTLYKFCEFAIKNFPAENYGLVFWNHGMGALDPIFSRQFSDFSFTNFYQPYRTYHTKTPSFLSLTIEQETHKGVCFDDTTNGYFTEKKLHRALQSIKTDILENKKFAFIGFDTCLMAMVEVASSISDFADYMVASQELELGAGWDYGKVLSIFTKESAPSPEEVGKHIVSSYKKTYFLETDLTLSCTNLKEYKKAEELLAALIKLLRIFYEQTDKKLFQSILRTSSHKNNCTHFDEPTYIDCIHFLENLLINFKASVRLQQPTEPILEKSIELLIQETINVLDRSIIANTAGRDFKRAAGLSIYFPTDIIDKTYKKNIFCSITQWALFLQTCL